jgi:phosphoribosylaminoimidazole-succinocarboxamide synthase
MHAVFETRLPLPNRRQGKVRDIYELPEDRGGPPGGGLLIVASDRISAFDVVMPTPIAGKGRLLTDISTRWFDFIRQRALAPTHLVSTSVAGINGITEADRSSLEGRSMIARRCRVVPIECVVRGYLDGSGWVDYQATGSVCGVALPKGLRRGDRLPHPIFTPATKEEMGAHDQNIDFERACAAGGKGVMERLRAMSLGIYNAAHAYAESRGVILADTKFEFGFPLDAAGNVGAEPMLIDEVLTPDSSRYWHSALWQPGKEQASFDKQFLREYLNGLVVQGKWNKQAPGPALPDDVVAGTLARYEEAVRRLFGQTAEASAVSSNQRAVV